MESRTTHAQRAFIFRNIDSQESEQLITLERTCFPPEQAIPEKSLRDLTRAAADLSLVAIDPETGKIAGALFGLATNEDKFMDDFFMKPEMHDNNGKNIMLLGLEVFPKYRGQGLARSLMEQYLQIERDRKRHEVFLTCVAGKIGMYERMGFVSHGQSASVLGGEIWYDMSIVLDAKTSQQKEND